jgi:hypothetical protein
LEEAVSLADRFLRTQSQGLSLEEDGSLRLTYRGRLLAVRLVWGGFPRPGRRFAAMTWRRVVHFRTVAEAAGAGAMEANLHNSLFFHIQGGGRRSPASMAVLLVHELVHVEQQGRALLGPAGFLMAYILGWARGGFRYRTNPCEVEARLRQEEAQRFVASPGGERG